jgi:hypothetical protein
MRVPFIDCLVLAVDFTVLPAGFLLSPSFILASNEGRTLTAVSQ